MKKLILSIIIALASVSFTFALTPDVELDISYYALTNHSIEAKASTLKQTSPAGIEANGVFYFAAPAKIIDIGISANTGIDTFNSYEGASISGNIDKGTNFFIGLGPVFRFNLGSFSSIYLCPEYLHNSQNIKNGISTLKTNYSAFNFDLGYRGWFVHTADFDMGVAAGYQFGIPLSGTSHSYLNGTELLSYDVNGGNFQKFYLGVCFNFGQKSSSSRGKFKKL